MEKYELRRMMILEMRILEGWKEMRGEERRVD